MMSKLFICCFLLICCASVVNSFSPPSASSVRNSCTRTSSNSVVVPSRTTSTQLSERRWNFNEGRAPWGMKTNAEIWNGRVAQMGFLFVFLQELITGKGVIQGLQEGDIVNIGMLGFTGLSVVGLTAWLAYQGDDSLTDDISSY